MGDSHRSRGGDDAREWGRWGLGVTVEAAIRSYLAVVGAVTALVGSRIYVLKAPQKPTSPYLRIQTISEMGDSHMRGPIGTYRARVQIDAAGVEGEVTYAQVAAVADAVDGALRGAPFSDAGSPPSLQMAVVSTERRVFYDAEELRLIRFVSDYMVWSRPA